MTAARFLSSGAPSWEAQLRALRVPTVVMLPPSLLPRQPWCCCSSAVSRPQLCIQYPSSVRFELPPALSTSRVASNSFASFLWTLAPRRTVVVFILGVFSNV
ncbi:hypothetical protein AMAG_19813 [Allomyces macrogynus ATCC 38327]|uniref:Uncharacterized protein n=1 Tax=Allomyces macrogynus (strain ATCC 38327) TaxID=578462 RepID=A0A0L0SZM3_ALLM3|nr:hypothetical protein AMAG_19813 [Allomyces macrogynus ATCC 38327]|eukprot:KNE67946.1 hypothetical protein AMAG_19813 [Allomyces macrogynus ATCC 38327]